MKLLPLLIHAVFPAVLAIGMTVATLSAHAQSRAAVQTYIVQLADAPVASYDGRLAGFAATQPARGTKLNVDAANVRAYIQLLDSKRNAAIAAVSSAGGGAILQRYNVAFNGFSAQLTAAEAQKMKGQRGVIAVTADEARVMDTTRTPAFLGLSTPGGLWSKFDSVARAVKGEDVIIGSIDGGIWPEDASFSDKVDPVSQKPVPYFQPGTQVYGAPPAKWKGSCVAGQGFNPATMCNNKLIGAKFFDIGFRAFGAPLWPTDYVGPRDEDGHGSHTASTAGGNENVTALINGIPVGNMSGMAPRARIAAYRVCWSYTNASKARQNSCFNSDIIAAVDQAISDGVDVINFSISGTLTNYLDPVEIAFFNAASAGVFVAASAGNAGPANTVAHMSPWLTTVAASTHDRYTVADLVLASGAVFSGPSYQTQGLPSTPLILSENAGLQPVASLSAADQTSLRRCYNAADRASLGATDASALDPVKVAGKIVVCIRGGNVLNNKGDAVKVAGAAGLVIQNTPATANTTILQPYVVPAIHLAASASSAVLAYAATAGATASFGPATQVPNVVAPVMADFSSRGPSLASASILKPDITAPGVDIIAAYVADNSNQQSVHDAIVAGATGDTAATSLQGTSMSSPHVAGVAALMKQLHPTWSPAAIKSALMTSTGPVYLANGSPDLARFGYGSGHLNPNPASDPGLVYDAGTADYLRFLCGVGSLSAGSDTCQNFGSESPWNLNLASLTAADVLGRITISRTVTNVGTSTATYAGTAEIAGWSATLVPSSLTLAPGASGSFDLNLSRTTATASTWVFGNVNWTDGVHQVRSPLTLRASLFTAPTTVDGTESSGVKVFSVGTGYAGSLAVTPVGLVAATVNNGSVSTDARQCFDLRVAAGTVTARAQLFNSDTQGGSASDLDLEVFNGPGGSGTMVGSSGNGGSNEVVSLNGPVAGTYSACVVGYAPQGGSATFALSTWVVGPTTGAQSLRGIGASKVYLGATASVGASWRVQSGSRYLGVLQYADGDGTPLGSTLLTVDAR